MVKIVEMFKVGSSSLIISSKNWQFWQFFNKLFDIAYSFNELKFKFLRVTDPFNLIRKDRELSLKEELNICELCEFNEDIASFPYVSLSVNKEFRRWISQETVITEGDHDL